MSLNRLNEVAFSFSKNVSTEAWILLSHHSEMHILLLNHKPRNPSLKPTKFLTGLQHNALRPSSTHVASVSSLPERGSLFPPQRLSRGITS